jgi:hypothetical protein
MLGLQVAKVLHDLDVTFTKSREGILGTCLSVCFQAVFDPTGRSAFDEPKDLKHVLDRLVEHQRYGAHGYAERRIAKRVTGGAYRSRRKKE